MSTLQEKAIAAQAKINPANVPGRPAAERKRVPMTLPQLTLEVPDIPGYFLYWHLGTPQDLARAEAAWFEFVDESEVQVTNAALGGDATKSGSTDLGSRVSVVAGSETGGDGQPVRLYLMKQKLEYHEEDQKILQNRNDSIADTLTASFREGTLGGRAEGETSDDVQHRYVNKARTKIPDLFQRKRRG